MFYVIIEKNMPKSFLIFLLFSFISFSQSKVNLYFETDSYHLTESEISRLNAFIYENKNKIRIIKVVGYCDYRASNSYNDSLAYNRANFVGGIIGKVTGQSNFTIESKGENFIQDKKLALNRKVEIYYEESYKVLKDKIKNSKKGDKLILENLYFFNNSGQIVPKSIPVLEELLEILKENEFLKIEIQGHICCQSLESAEKIEDIALVRALAVYSYLIEKGIDKNRLNYKSFKSTQPIFSIPERNEEERNANRRVEILILEN